MGIDFHGFELADELRLFDVDAPLDDMLLLLGGISGFEGIDVGEVLLSNDGFDKGTELGFEDDSKFSLVKGIFTEVNILSVFGTFPPVDVY
jgi:hypothetical protein